VTGGGLVAVVIALVGLPPLPQLPGYHGLADTRTWLGIPNAGDVLSNLPFALVGLWGLHVIFRTPIGSSFTAQAWPLPYALFFAAVILVCPGSAYYHWAPTNATLVWDRLPMSVAFMAIFTAVIGYRIGEHVARVVLWPLIVFGLGTVIYWAMTDDLRPYYVMQFLPMALIPALCLLFPAGPGLANRHVAVLLGSYILAKVLETFDWPIWEALGRTVSGHSLKHVAAAAGCLAVIAAIRSTDVRREQ